MDSTRYQEIVKKNEEIAERAFRRLSQRNHAIRMAAVRGDWDGITRQLDDILAESGSAESVGAAEQDEAGNVGHSPPSNP